jgi:hypothetical protein
MHNLSGDDTLDLLKDFLPDVYHLPHRSSRNSGINSSQTFRNSTILAPRWS